MSCGQIVQRAGMCHHAWIPSIFLQQIAHNMRIYKTIMAFDLYFPLPLIYLLLLICYFSLIMFPCLVQSILKRLCARYVLEKQTSLALPRCQQLQYSISNHSCIGIYYIRTAHEHTVDSHYVRAGQCVKGNAA